MDDGESWTADLTCIGRKEMGGIYAAERSNKRRRRRFFTNRADTFRVAGDGRWWKERKADGKITSNMFIIDEKLV